jgi:hypothetical protein
VLSLSWLIMIRDAVRSGVGVLGTPDELAAYIGT